MLKKIRDFLEKYLGEMVVKSIIMHLKLSVLAVISLIVAGEMPYGSLLGALCMLVVVVWFVYPFWWYIKIFIQIGKALGTGKPPVPKDQEKGGDNYYEL